MSVFDKLVEFSKTRDLWQQDLLRRIVTQADLVPGDIDAALVLLKEHIGVVPPGTGAAPIPLSGAHVPHRAAAAPKSTLGGLSDLRLVGRLVGSQNLPFAPTGITLVYGDNGSGKTGYCRVLKKLCRARLGGQDPIRPDVFGPAPAAKAQATVRFTVNGQPESTLTWTDGTPPPTELSRISVFDSKTASLYSDAEGKIEFLPEGLDVLPRLAGACQTLAKLLEIEVAPLAELVKAPLPAFHPGSSAARLYSRLTTATPAGEIPSPAEITTLGTWAPSDDSRLEELRGHLGGDPRARAVTLKRIAAGLRALDIASRKIEESLSAEHLAAHDRAFRAATEARDAARLAAASSFAGEPLPGVGGQPWRRMFEFAREFSATAYPGSTFPVTGTDRRCLLCQQVLSDEASDRLKRFARFVSDRAESEARRLETARDVGLETLRHLAFPLNGDIDPTLAAAEEQHPSAKGLSEDVHGFIESALVRHKKALDLLATGGDIATIPPTPTCPSEHLTGVAAQLDALAVECEKTALDATTRAAAVKEFEELTDRKELARHVAPLQRVAQSLVALNLLRRCLAACDTTLISRKTSELRREELTTAFAERLAEECKALSVDYIQLRLRDRTDRGDNYLEVTLDTSARVRNSEILSEGEQRALALAGFFTEIATIPGANGIVIDDPVSSLDHPHRLGIAARLVAEAEKGRQVIVFTHDVVFLHELVSASAERGVPVMSHWIRRVGDVGFGTVEKGEAPWDAKDVGARARVLEKMCGDLRAHTDRTGSKYLEAVKVFYSHLRETWERLVEEDLLRSVIGRLSSDVKTQSLREVEVNDDDHKVVFFAMKRASAYSGHDRARAKSLPPPPPDTIAEHLKELMDFRKALKQRCKVTKGRRERLEVPPASTGVDIAGAT